MRGISGRWKRGPRQDYIQIGWRQSLSLIGSYAARLIKPQMLSIGLVVVYLIAFQTLVLGIPLRGALGIGLGTLACVVGLSAFLEGLFLGIMPLGSQCGMRLPIHSKALGISLFAFILGIGATLAEPAIGFLRAAGSSVKAWESPLTFALLNRHELLLTLAIAGGVGLAAVLGILRFLLRLPFKPFVLIITPLVLIVSVMAFIDPKLRPILGLAWDSGGITTGPVTVPLVLALGIGMSRVLGGRGSGTAEGFGVVTLASLVAVATVILLGLCISPQIPQASSQESFFSPEMREQALRLFSQPAELDAYAHRHLRAEDWARYQENNPEASAPLSDALKPDIVKKSRATLILSLRAILPLSLFLLATLLLLKEKIRQADELFLGLFLSILGLFLFNYGMESGLSPIGAQTGAVLPASYSALPMPEEAIEIPNFDPSLVQPGIKPNGEKTGYFNLSSPSGKKEIEYDPAAYDSQSRVYSHLPLHGPVFGSGRLGWGLVLLAAFAFFLGYGVTAAEPSLLALGIAVEDLSAGTFRKGLLVSSTAVGVGIGLAVGFMRILWDIPLLFILGPVYLGLLVLTLFSSDDFAALAWDAAGVTTGPVTVPLVIATGLGIGGQTGALDSFGILSCASAFPIAAVLLSGIGLNGWIKPKALTQTTAIAKRGPKRRKRV